jgi:Rps23 Pro-64 3,4-dihydroxylase Tpa1-like proline 4-hydroxylase
MISNTSLLQEAKNKYTTESPKFVIMDNLFDEGFILKCQDEFLALDDSEFVHYANPYFEYEKYSMNDQNKMPENLVKLFRYIHSTNFIKSVSDVTGIKDLLVDEKRWGGGLHKTKEGGYLSIHKDFNILPTTYSDDKQMLRCVNLIGYLNSSWKPGDGGELEFWTEDGVKEVIEPKFNRWVLFDTRNNFHGHPYPYKGDSPRISIASYYYIRTNVIEGEWSSTEYLKLPWMDESEEYATKRKERADHKLRYSNLIKNV